MLTAFRGSNLWDSAFLGVALEAELSSRTPAWWSQDPCHKHLSGRQPRRCSPTWKAVQISLAEVHPLYFPKSVVTVIKRTFTFQHFVHHWLPAPLHIEATLRLESSLFCHWVILPPENFSAFSQYKIINMIIFLGPQHVLCWIFWEAEAARHFHLERPQGVGRNNNKMGKKERYCKRDQGSVQN